MNNRFFNQIERLIDEVRNDADRFARVARSLLVTFMLIQVLRKNLDKFDLADVNMIQGGLDYINTGVTIISLGSFIYRLLRALNDNPNEQQQQANNLPIRFA